MCSHTLILLATTMLGSLADGDFLKDRRNNYNSNVNNNKIYDISRGSDIDSGKIRGGLYNENPTYGFILRPEIPRERNRGVVYDSPRYSLRDRGIGDEYGLADDDSEYLMCRLAGICDENPKGLLSEDDGREGCKRARFYRPYYPLRRENNLNSNANSNIIGSRNRRPSNWGTRPEYGGALKYDRYGGYGAGVFQNTRDQKLWYGEGDQKFGLPGRYQGFKTILPNRYTTSRPYYIRSLDIKEDGIDEEDYADPSQSDNNVNVNSNMNIMSRRNNVNANTNQNTFSRIRRSINSSEESDRDDKISAGTSTTSDFESSTSHVAKKREDSHGPRY